MATTVYRNTILSFAGSWGSGLATLIFAEGNQVPCENGATVRALDACVSLRSDDPTDPDNWFVQRGHVVDNDKIAGLEIAWSYDELGLIFGGFTPYDDWLEDGKPELDFGPNEVEVTDDGEIVLLEVA